MAVQLTQSGQPANYNLSPKTLSDGDPSALNVDATGNLKVTEATAFSKDIDSISTREANYSYAYQAAAAANVVVKASAGYLKGIIIGTDVGSAVIEISDHASDGDGAVKIYLAGSTLLTSTGGYLPVNAYFATGITADITNQTHVTFIYE